MPVIAKPPGVSELDAVLGSASSIWNAIIEHAETTYVPLTQTWKPSKTEFGKMCLLQYKKRTLAYLTPDNGLAWVAVILGERAYQLAMASSLPDEIKKLLHEAKPYVEGRGIRFSVNSLNQLASVVTLLEVKTARP
jgi:hypothetical protein